MWLPGTFLNQSLDTKIKVKIGQNLKIKSTVKGLIKLFKLLSKLVRHFDQWDLRHYCERRLDVGSYAHGGGGGGGGLPSRAHALRRPCLTAQLGPGLSI